MSEQEALKLIPYGIAGFKQIRADNYVYVDKTKHIETLEKSGVKYPFFVRPRRFGKSLFLDTLSAYYDKNEAEHFDENFRGTYIAAHKTPLANQYCILKFSFAGMSNAMEEKFYYTVRNSLVDFFERYPHSKQDAILEKQFPGAETLIESFFSILGSAYRQKLYIIIDEYDQFANAVLAKNLPLFREITSTDGYLKDFYTKLKAATDDNGPVARIFITGVTSISLDSMTSGFSIAQNLSTFPQFAGLYGFNEAELKAVIPQVVDLEACGLSADEVFRRMKEWYNGYRFSVDSDETVFNASMSFYYLSALRNTYREPQSMPDPAFAQDMSKISGILKLGDPDFVKSIVTKALQNESIEFPAGDLQLLNLNRHDELDENELLSAMVYLGYLTFAPGDSYALVVPNKAVAIQFFEYYQKFVLALPRFKFAVRYYSEAYQALAKGDPAPLFRLVCNRFTDQSGLHTNLHLSESDFQTLLAASLYFTDEFEVRREVEAVGGARPGFVDLLIQPSQGKVGPAYLVELKHLKKSAGTEAAVKVALANAMVQAKSYAASSSLKSIPNLKCVAAVFVGTQLKELAVD